MQMPWSHRSRACLARLYYDPAFTLPLSGVELPSGIDPRRAQLALWYLTEQKLVGSDRIVSPPAVEFDQLGRVHDASYLESLFRPEVLARIFAIEGTPVPVEEILRTVRLACGGTVAAARCALETRSAALNLLGGFHHAGPASGGGFCAVNDVAVAIAVARQEGFKGRVVVLDLDAHPPDGTAECLQGDAGAWIGSISGVSWAALPRVDETVLPPGSTDAEYLEALSGLLQRMPRPDLAFVNAGGDVLAQDAIGKLALSLRGVRQRDCAVRDALSGVPTVWLPAGGYSSNAWRVLAGTGLVLLGKDAHVIAENADPLRAQFSRTSLELRPEELHGSALLTEADIEGALHVPRASPPQLLGFYTPQGLELALSRYGVWQHVQRLGYGNLHVAVSAGADGERAQLLGSAEGREHCIIDLVVERSRFGGDDYLFVNWLALRDPRSQFTSKRPALPGQDTPGLGIAREMGEILRLMARRLGLKGVAFRPSWYHMAYAARRQFHFRDEARQARFEALVQALSGLSLMDATRAVAEGRVTLEGEPYAWEPDEMFQNSEDAPSQASAAGRPDFHFALTDARAGPAVVGQARG